jgi:ATPase, putative
MEVISVKLNVAEFLEKEIKVYTSKPLWPIYEAISNSIYAESKNIKIYLIKEKNNQVINKGNFKKKIQSVYIEDDGVGFTDENFESFNSAYQSNKFLGKGKGRFFYLKYFEKVRIESIFRKENRILRRSFEFLPSKDGVEKEKIEEVSTDIKKTKIELLNIDEKIVFPRDIEDIGWDIIIHFFLIFYKDKAIDIEIIDNETKENIKLRNLFDDELRKLVKTNEIKIDGVAFKIEHAMISKSKGINSSEMFLTAQNRIVKTQNLSKTYFASLTDDKYLLCFISSEYLDERVNSNREDFEIRQQVSLNLKYKEYIEENTIISEVLKKLEDIYSKLINEIMKKRENRINEYLKDSINASDKLLFDSYRNEILGKVLENSKSDKIGELFDNKKREIKKQTYTELKKIKNEDKNLKEKIQEISEKIDITMKSALADYIIQRKLIIELYYKLLEGTPKELRRIKGKSIKYEYSKEDEIHNLIFPMKKINLEVDYNEHNLWLIDDTLSFQTFIASDLEIKDFIKDSEEKSRPDLLFFSDYDTKGFIDSITIIELKRPELNPKIREESPAKQVIRYVSLLKNRKAKVKGKELKIGDITRFYVYILMDLNKDANEIFEIDDFTPLREQRGYFKYHNQYNVYITVLDYNLIGQDAERRNNAFFEKLGLK